MSYMVCHGMKSKVGDVKNIEKHIERKNKDYKNSLMSIFWKQKVKIFYATLLASNSH